MTEDSRLARLEARFEALVRDYGRLLRSVIVRFCPRSVGLEIRDIEQEAKLRLWRALESEREVSNPASYIYRIGMTAAIDATRRVVARHERQLADEESEDASPKRERPVPSWRPTGLPSDVF